MAIRCGVVPTKVCTFTIQVTDCSEEGFCQLVVASEPIHMEQYQAASLRGFSIENFGRRNGSLVRDYAKDKAQPVSIKWWGETAKVRDIVYKLIPQLRKLFGWNGKVTWEKQD